MSEQAVLNLSLGVTMMKGHHLGAPSQVASESIGRTNGSQLGVYRRMTDIEWTDEGDDEYLRVEHDGIIVTVVRDNSRNDDHIVPITMPRGRGETADLIYAIPGVVIDRVKEMGAQVSFRHALIARGIQVIHEMHQYNWLRDIRDNN